MNPFPQAGATFAADTSPRTCYQMAAARSVSSGVNVGSSSIHTGRAGDRFLNARSWAKMSRPDGHAAIICAFYGLECGRRHVVRRHMEHDATRWRTRGDRLAADEDAEGVKLYRATNPENSPNMATAIAMTTNSHSAALNSTLGLMSRHTIRTRANPTRSDSLIEVALFIDRSLVARQHPLHQTNDNGLRSAVIQEARVHHHMSWRERLVVCCPIFVTCCGRCEGWKRASRLSDKSSVQRDPCEGHQRVASDRAPLHECRRQNSQRESRSREAARRGSDTRVGRTLSASR